MGARETVGSEITRMFYVRGLCDTPNYTLEVL